MSAISCSEIRQRIAGLERLCLFGELRDLSAQIVAAAGRQERSQRSEHSLYGAPGTGKSEFAKTLGAHVGFSVQFFGESNDENGEPSRNERIAALLIANAIGALARRTIIVVDEADDLFVGVDEDDASKHNMVHPHSPAPDERASKNGPGRAQW